MEKLAFLAYSGGNFWGAGLTEAGAVVDAQENHIKTAGLVLNPDDIELTTLTGAAAELCTALIIDDYIIDDLDAIRLTYINQ